MAKSRRRRIIALGLVLVAAGIGAYWLSRPEPTPPVVGVVRSTEVRIAPEVGGQLGASLWEVMRDWRGLWVLAVIYFALAVMSAFLVKRRQVHG